MRLAVGSRWVGGVETFLVIASFFCTTKYLKKEDAKIDVGETFLHRVRRIYPVYLAIVALATVGGVLYKHISAESIWYVFSLQNFRCLFSSATYNLDFLLGHFWYISLDIWLFLFWIVLLRSVPRKHWRFAFIVSFTLGVLWRTLTIIVEASNYPVAYVLPIGQLDGWALGGLVALNVREHGNKKTIFRNEIIVGLIGIVALTVFNAIKNNCNFAESYQLWRSSEWYMKNPLTCNISVFVAILSAGLLRYCFDTKRKHPFLSSRVLIALGGLSYELYCFHYPIICITRHFIHNDFLLVVVALFVTLLTSLTWKRLERKTKELIWNSYPK